MAATITPLFQETRDSIRARMDTNANAGLEPADPAYRDTREGSFFYETTEPFVLELALLWDAVSVELPSIAFVIHAWGEYLDAHAEQYGIERDPAAKAVGYQRFAGPAGTFIPEGTVVTSPSVTEDDSVDFSTTSAATTLAGISAPTGLVATANNSGGTLTTDTYDYKVTAINAEGETTPSSADDGVISGATGRVDLDWADVAGATGYKVYRKRTAESVYGYIATTETSAYSDVGGIEGGVEAPSVNSTVDAVSVPIVASVAGIEGNVAIGAITVLSSPVPGVTGVTNVVATSGGADAQSDAELRAEILGIQAGSGGGNQADYRRWVLAYPGIGNVWVVPVWDGPNSVLVVIVGDDGAPVNGAVVDGVQTLLDPIPGEGAGLAPIGATVTVETPTITDINIGATLTFLDGYSLDGEGGTIAVREEIVASIDDYINNLGVGDDVIYDHVKATLFVDGVYSVSGVTVNGGTSDILIPTSPATIARIVTPPALLAA